MLIRIQSKNLVDFPYDPLKPQYNELFSFDEEKIGNLVSDLLYASPTCYLISGYRGSGKTSFIKRVQELCVKKISSHTARLNELKSASSTAEIRAEIEQLTSHFPYQKVLFVYSSFSRYENQTLFLRKIIRDMQETVQQQDRSNKSPLTVGVGELYYKTFYQVRKEREKVLKKEAEVEFKLELDELFRQIRNALLLFIIPIASESILSPVWKLIAWSLFPWLKALIYVALFVWGILLALKVSARYSIKHTFSEKVTEAAIDDDNITEYYLEEIIDKFNDENYKLVFVLDELDKVEEDEQAKLLNEMKPWLVRGKADFIIVAGQKLTMKYYQLKDRDDEVLASLFSKIIHVGLLPEQKLRSLFNDYLILGVYDKDNLSSSLIKTPEIIRSTANICNSYIYRSRRLPRTFMNLVRQDLKWDDEVAYLDVSDKQYSLEGLKIQVLIKMAVQLNINAEIGETIREHLLMQLFRVATLITEENRHDVNTIELISRMLDPVNAEKYGAYTYPNLAAVLQESIDGFCQEALTEKLIEPGSDKQTTRNVSPPDASTLDRTDTINELEKNELNEFARDFVSFSGLLQRYVERLIPEKTKYNQPDKPLREIFKAYTEKKIIDLDIGQSSLFAQPLSHYSAQQLDLNAFIDVYELFKKNHISLPNLFQSIARYYVQKSLHNILADGRVGYESASPEYMLPTQKENSFLIIHDKEKYPIHILFEFIFINATVEIGNEQTARAVDILDSLNLQTGTGCYYIPLIIYKSNTGIHSERVVVSANYGIERLRPDLKEKISYIIISIHSLEELHQKLIKILDSALPYSTTPRVKPGLKPVQKKVRKMPVGIPASELPVTDPEDTQKGRWGGTPSGNGRVLSARVTPSLSNEGWYDIHLKVAGESNNPLTGKVTFYLHDSFNPGKKTVYARDNVAEITDLLAYEAFTVGVTCDNNITMLELDLNELPEAPEDFKY